jgi:cytochrome P450
MFVISLFLIYIVLCVIFCLLNRRNLKNFPPGPSTLPVIGSIHEVRDNIRDAFQRWRIKYGDIVGFQLGPQNAVLLSDFETLKKAFSGDSVTGRPDNIREVFHAFFQKDDAEKSDGGLVFSQGQHWKEQRRFALRTLRDFGFGKSSMQGLINEEVAKLVEELSGLTGKPTNLAYRSNMAVVNSLWQILNGEKSDIKNPKMEKVFRGTTKFVKENNLNGLLMLFPKLRHFPYFKTLFEKSRKSPQEMREVTSEAIKSHIDTHQEEHARDFMDCYINKIHHTADPTSSFYGDKGMANMQRVIMDLFGAGSETTSTILTFAFLYLTRWPEVQAKVQAEIDRVVGNCAPTLDDRQKMPYTEAVIHEILRYSCLNYTVPHNTTEEVEIGGYTLPAGTAVYPNTWWIHNDPGYWSEPHLFNPDRFIKDGHFVKDEHCIPFMIGKRFCPGQMLAQHQLFLFLTGLLQQFSFLAPCGDCTKVNTEAEVGFMQICPDYNVIIESRHTQCDQN